MAVAAILRWIGIKWSLWKHAVAVVITGIFSLVCYIVGWRMSDATHPGPLVHAGALATAFSVMATLYDYKSALKAGEDKAIETFANITAGFPLTGKQSQEDVERKLKGNTRWADRLISTVQAVLLLIATLVWGFADVAPDLVPGAFRQSPAVPHGSACGSRAS